MSYALLILGMAAITYAIRTTLFLFGERLTFPPLVRTALGFVPVTVLTAIIVPMTVARTAARPSSPGATRSSSARSRPCSCPRRPAGRS